MIEQGRLSCSATFLNGCQYNSHKHKLHSINSHMSFRPALHACGPKWTSLCALQLELADCAYLLGWPLLMATSRRALCHEDVKTLEASRREECGEGRRL